MTSQRRSIQRPSQMNSPMSKRTSNPNHSNHSNQNVTANTNKDNTLSANDKRTQSLNTLPSQTLIHLLQIKEEERKRTKKLLKNALVQLEVAVGRGDVLEGQVRELEEKVERERVERERGGGLDLRALKGVLDEQRGRAGGGLEVEGLKLRLSNTEKELQVFSITRIFFSLLIGFLADNVLKRITGHSKSKETIQIGRWSEHER